MPHSVVPGTAKLDPRASLLGKDLKAQLQEVLTDNTTQAASRCARICEERIEAARREERRRHMLEKQVSSGAAPYCAWTRGFFDYKLEDLSKTSQADQVAPNNTSAGTVVKEKTPFGEVDCLRLLKNSFLIKEKISQAYRQGEVEPHKAKRAAACSTQNIMRMTEKLMQERGDERGEQPPPPPGGTLRGAKPRSAAPPELSVGTHESKQRSTGRRSDAQVSLRDSAAPGAAGGAEDETIGPNVNYPPAVPPLELHDLPNSRVEAAKRKTAQSLELSRVLEELTEGLRTARIINPEDKKLCPVAEA